MLNNFRKTSDELMNLDETFLRNIPLKASQQKPSGWIKKVPKKVSPPPKQDITISDQHLHEVFNDTAFDITQQPSTSSRVHHETSKRFSSPMTSPCIPPRKVIILDMTKNDDSLIDVDRGNSSSDDDHFNLANISISSDMFRMSPPAPPPPAPAQPIINPIASVSVHTMESDSQVLSTPQLEQLIRVTDSAINENVTIEQDGQAEVFQDTELDKMFNDVADNDFVIDMMQSSQKFLRDVKSVQKHNISRLTVARSSQPPTIRNVTNGSEYIQRQRSMAELNDENIGEEFLNHNLTNLLNSSQYRTEVETVFNDCERSIIQTNVSRSQAQREEAINNIHDINWDESQVVIPKTQKGERSFFCDMGPFYGLPLQVKRLIKEFKGIDDLYGK